MTRPGEVARRRARENYAARKPLRHLHYSEEEWAEVRRLADKHGYSKKVARFLLVAARAFRKAE